MCADDRQTGERWRDVSGYGGKYQVSDEGRVRMVRPDGSIKILAQYLHNGGDGHSRSCVVRLRDQDGRRRHASVIGLVAGAWLQVPPGKYPYHLNGMLRENALWNIGLATRKQLGMRFGPMAKARGVYKIDTAGAIVACYRSANEAGRQNGLSGHVVRAHCNGKRVYEYRPDGTTFVWDDVPRKDLKR